MTARVQEDLRFRTRRLIQRGGQAEDLSRLFLGLRELRTVQQTVLEVANFVAHRLARDRGFTTAYSSDWYRMFKYIAQVSYGVPPPDADRHAAMKAALSRIPEDLLKGKLQHSRQRASQSLADAYRRGYADLTPDQQSLLTFVEESLPQTAFSAGLLLEQLELALHETGVLSPTESEGIHNASTLITLFTIVQMHGSELVMYDGTKVPLSADGSCDTRHLGVWAHQPVSPKPDVIVTIVWRLFGTSLKTSEFVSAEMSNKPNWLVPIEVRHGKIIGNIR